MSGNRVPAGHAVFLRQACDETVTQTDPRRRPNEEFRYIDISSVDNIGKRITDARPIRGSDAPSRARQVVRAGDVLVATTRPNLNAVAAIPDDLDGAVCSTGFCVLRARPDTLNPRYLFLYVQSPQFIRRVSSLVVGALYPAVTDGQVLGQTISLPALADQLRIAARLTEQLVAVERARKAAEERLATLGRLESAEFKRAFLGITPLAADRVRDDPPPGWRWKKLTDVARLESGHTPSRYHPEWWGGPVPWIALPDIRALDGEVAYDTIEHTNDAGIANSSARILPADTVVLSRTASVGFVTVMGREMATSQDFVNWVCGPNLDASYLALVLRASRGYIRSLSSGAIHKTVYVPTVKRFEVCAPSLDEQRRIAARLSASLESAASMATTAEVELVAIEALPAALLREVFVA